MQDPNMNLAMLFFFVRSVTYCCFLQCRYTRAQDTILILRCAGRGLGEARRGGVSEMIYFSRSSQTLSKLGHKPSPARGWKLWSLVFPDN